MANTYPTPFQYPAKRSRVGRNPKFPLFSSTTPRPDPPRFRNPHTLVNTVRSIAWAPAARTHTVSGAFASFNATELADPIRTPVSKQILPHGTATHYGKDAVVKSSSNSSASQSAEKPSLAPTYFDTLFATLCQDYSVWDLSHTPPNPQLHPPPTYPYISRMVRSVRNLALGDNPHPDVKRFQFCRKIGTPLRKNKILFEPSGPWNPCTSHHVIYALWSDAGIYVGYTANPQDRCKSHLSAIFAIARKYAAGLPMMPLTHYDTDPDYKYHALARSADPVRFVVLCELHPPATTDAIKAARIAALLPENIRWKENFDLETTFATHQVTPTKEATKALKDATQAWLTAGGSILEAYFITQLRAHCRTVLPSGIISKERSNPTGFNDNAGIQAGKARSTLNRSKNQRRDHRQRAIVKIIAPPPHPKLALTSLLFALYFPSRPILTSDPVYTAFLVKRVVNNKFVGSPLDDKLKTLDLDTLRHIRLALVQTNLNEYPTPLITSAINPPVPVPVFQPLSSTPIYPSRGAVRQFIMTLDFAIGNKSFRLTPRRDPSDHLRATLDFVDSNYLHLTTPILQKAVLDACTSHHLLIPLAGTQALLQWRAGTPFGVADVFNHSSFAKYYHPNLDTTPCNCHLLPHKFCDASGHLSTNDPRVFLEPPFPQTPHSSSLVNKLTKGTMTRFKVKLTPTEAKQLLSVNIVRFQKVISYACDFPWPQNWGGNLAATAWADKVATDLYDTITTQASAAPMPYQEESLSYKERAFLINHIQDISVATFLEKSSNNFHWVCKKRYGQICKAHLDSPEYTTIGPLPLPPDAPPGSQQAPGPTGPALDHLATIEDHINSFPLIKEMNVKLKKRAAGKKANSEFTRHPPTDPTIPAPPAPSTPSPPPLFRMQAKPKVKPNGDREMDGGRPICASGGSADYPIDLLVTSTESFLNHSRDNIWQRTFTHPGLDYHGQIFSPADLARIKSLAFPRFILRNTEAAVDLVKQYNRDRLSTLHFAARQPPSLTTLDFTAMYTNLPLNGPDGILANHLKELTEIENLLKSYNLACHLRYHINNEGKYTVSFTKDPPCNVKGKPLVMTLSQRSTQLFSFLLTNACVVFDGQLRLQVDGIAMGKSAAVLIANNSTAWFELIFVRQLVSKRHFSMLFDFRYFARYIDDCIAINIRWIMSLRYQEDTYTPPEGGLPLNGIYPHFAPLPPGTVPPAAIVLTLNLEGSLHLPGPLRALNPMGVTFLDSMLFWNTTTRLFCWCTFDKRILEKFDCTHFLRFPCYASVLWPTCFYGIVHSEFGRFHVTNATLQLFANQAGDLMIELYTKRYDWLKIWKEVDVFLKRHTPLYDRPRGLKPRQLKWITERVLVARASWRYDTGLPLLHHRLQRLGFPTPTPTPIPPFPDYYPTYNPQHLSISAWIKFLPKTLSDY